MKYLIKKGSQVHMSNSEGYTSLHFAVLKGISGCFLRLLCPYLLPNETVNTLSLIPCYVYANFLVYVSDNLELVKFLLMKGAPIEADSVNGTPLQCAASCGSVETVKLLLKNGAEVGKHIIELHSFA